MVMQQVIAQGFRERRGYPEDNYRIRAAGGVGYNEGYEVGAGFSLQKSLNDFVKLF